MTSLVHREDLECDYVGKQWNYRRLVLVTADGDEPLPLEERTVLWLHFLGNAVEQLPGLRPRPMPRLHPIYSLKYLQMVRKYKHKP